MTDLTISRRNLFSAGAAIPLTLHFSADVAGAPVAADRLSVKLREIGGASVTDFGARSDGRSDAAPAFAAAFASQSGARSSPPGLRGWGVGLVSVPKGVWTLRAPIAFADSQVGFAFRGEADYATSLVFDLTAGAALPAKTYVAVAISDMHLRNIAARPGDSVGIALDPQGGGGQLSIKRMSIDGFGTAIRLGGDGNGDKTLVEQTTWVGPVGFDQGRNKQAVGWTFLNCAGSCSDTHFRLGGAGELLIANNTSDVFGSFIALPEASGNSGTGPKNYLGSRTTVMSTKLEYHGSGERMLIDARGSKLLADSGGSNCDIVLREVSLASGSSWPDTATHTVIQVGDERAGSDAIRVKQEGGWIEGVIRHGSAQLGPLNRRWSFRDAIRAPDPATVSLLGPGSHPMMEWRANENVPVDQYRGGQAFTGAIDAKKAFLWRHSGSALLNTGVAGRAFGERIGENFTIAAFPPGTAQVGLAVYLDRPLPADESLEIAQFADAGYARPFGPPLVLKGGTAKGLYRIHDEWHNMEAGAVYLRITAGGRGRRIPGAIVIFYFPYMGS